MMEILRNEHPRPDRVRENWCTLNGQWQFAFDPSNAGRREKWYRTLPATHQIEVPFCYQSKLSGIDCQEHCDVVWYERSFTVPAGMTARRLLHFGAADYRADVWLDGQYLGSHEGGYTPFTFDVTDLTEASGEYILTVRCEDRLDFDQPRGKQSYRPEAWGCWYTPVTGIWQSVWLEGVGEYYPTDFRLTPCIERGSLKVEITLNELPSNGAIRLTASMDGRLAARQEVAVTSDRFLQTELFLRHDETLEGFRLWRPDDPALYDLRIETLVDGAIADQVDTYFGMRKIEIIRGCVTLNNSPLYQRLVLDQGYWPDGLLTAPSDDALRRDIELTLAMGYNGARKHQKFEDPRYLYWADKLGLLVWGELPSAYWLRDSQKRSMMRDLSEAIRRDYNHPCLITWVPINESWGVPFIQTQREAQKLADALYHMIHALDGTRPVSVNDGWEQTCTDLVTIHDYTGWPESLTDGYQDRERLLNGNSGHWKLTTAVGYDNLGKPMLLTEYGGIAMAKDAGDGNWGYNGAEQDEAAFFKRFEAITQAFKHLPGFSGYCYTQLTDVFQEVNGLLDMDRNPKVDIEQIRRINLQR
ncbi:MAG: beta galactosidase jelly roll domain-containing protein [Clostridia bacterium]|nr:beta galactosidase jelly roll domain-containing protein [Clostridia bacterium]